MRGLDPRISLPKIVSGSPGPARQLWFPKMPARLFLSSGDLMADRRFDFARDLQLKGDLAAAADLLMQAIELAPNFTSAWFTLGGIREELGEHRAAIAAFQKAQASDPGDRHGAGLRLMRLGAEPVSGMPQAYVQTLFDQYAPRFEASLVGDLGYRGPALLFKAVLSVRSAARKPAFFKRAIDLGCGTGLAAAAFARMVDHFIGVDLSPRMIERARATVALCGAGSRRHVAGSARAAGRQRGSHSRRGCDGLCRRSGAGSRGGRRVLAPGGLLAFTAETHGGEGVVIGQGLRYAHAAAYVRAAVDGAGLKLSLLEDRSARNEDNAPVPGLVVVAAKT